MLFLGKFRIILAFSPSCSLHFQCSPWSCSLGKFLFPPLIHMSIIASVDVFSYIRPLTMLSNQINQRKPQYYFFKITKNMTHKYSHWVNIVSFFLKNYRITCKETLFFRSSSPITKKRKKIPLLKSRKTLNIFHIKILPTIEFLFSWNSFKLNN